MKPYFNGTDIYDSFIFFADDSSWNKIIFTLNNIDNKNFIVFNTWQKTNC